MRRIALYFFFLGYSHRDKNVKMSRFLYCEESYTCGEQFKFVVERYLVIVIRISRTPLIAKYALYNNLCQPE